MVGSESRLLIPLEDAHLSLCFSDLLSVVRA